MTENSQNTVICPNCQKENQGGAQICAYCGTPIVSTLPIPDISTEEPPVATLHVPEPSQHDISCSTITFVVPGNPEPLVVRRQEIIILGRYVVNEPPPTVDLSKYNGHLLGVSRRHALIRCTHTGCTIQDLGSANGTWVNKVKLTPHQFRPLKGGEQIQLGNLILFVHFSTVASVFLVDMSETPSTDRGLTPQYLMTQVGPYLQTLADLQTLVNELLGRKPSDVLISTIAMISGSAVNVMLENAVEAVQLVKEKVVPWKRHATVIPHTRNTQTLLEARRTAEIQQAQAESSGGAGQDPAPLAQVILQELAPNLEDEKKAALLQKLMPTLQFLTTSTLEMTDAAPTSV